jgi:hypothetical protein
MLQAQQYPDVWTFSNECPCPPENYPKECRVDTLIDSFLMPEFFGRIVIWPTTADIRKVFSIAENKGYRVIDNVAEAQQLRRKLKLICEGGHMQVLFVPKSSGDFLKKLLSMGHYGQASEVLLGSGKTDDPLHDRPNYKIKFLESVLFESGESIFAFSHDAEFLYVIERK